MTATVTKLCCVHDIIEIEGLPSMILWALKVAERMNERNSYSYRDCNVYVNDSIQSCANEIIKIRTQHMELQPRICEKTQNNTKEGK